MEVIGEQALLGFEVRLEAAVKVEMVAGQVREDGRVESEPADAFLDQGVRGNLESRMSHVLVDHFLQQLLQIERFGRGQRGTLRSSRDSCFYRSKQARDF